MEVEPSNPCPPPAGTPRVALSSPAGAFQSGLKCINSAKSSYTRGHGKVIPRAVCGLPAPQRGTIAPSMAISGAVRPVQAALLGSIRRIRLRSKPACQSNRKHHR
jgi:hypothetical protein